MLTLDSKVDATRNGPWRTFAPRTFRVHRQLVTDLVDLRDAGPWLVAGRTVRSQSSCPVFLTACHAAFVLQEKLPFTI